jgi:hypothetical protein
MAWGDEKQAGFVLAAVLAGDRELFSVSDSIDAELLPALQARFLREHSERVRSLRELASAVRPPLSNAAALPVRGRALLAQRVPRELGRSYVREAPAARPGFEPEPALSSWLEQLARHGGSP